MDELSSKLSTLFMSNRHLKIVKRDTFLFKEGDRKDELYIIKAGKIQIGKNSSDGRKMILRIASAGDIVGELSLFSTDSKYVLNASVLEEGEVLVIKKSLLEKELANNGALAVEFTKMMGSLYLRDQLKLRDLVLYGKKGALYSTLIRFSNSYGKQQKDGVFITVPLTNQELADFCGTARESVNRLLNDLKKDDVLSIKRKHIIIHDLQYLKNEIHCENCPISLCTIN